MPCFRPLPGWRTRAPNPNTGNLGITFSFKDANPDRPLEIPCGQCRYCRFEHSRQWALRCFHEASLYQNNCFLTLTYSDQFLPKNHSLDYTAPVLFMKRLREKYGSGIRSYGCAEYGEKLGRPHYHIAVFNHDFYDKKLFKKSLENKLYTSEQLSGLWPFGHSTIGDLTFESAAYIARYVTKKITGEASQKHYERTCPTTGEIHTLLPERSISVSRRPAIGKDWYEKYGKFVRDHDFVIIRGHKMRPPKYYDRLHERLDAASHKSVKADRAASGAATNEKTNREDAQAYSQFKWEHGSCSPKPRLYVMEDVQELKIKQLKRNLENGQT